MVANGVNQGASAQAWEGARKVKSDMRVSWQRPGGKILLCTVGRSALCSKKWVKLQDELGMQGVIHRLVLLGYKG